MWNRQVGSSQGLGDCLAKIPDRQASNGKIWQPTVASTTPTSIPQSELKQPVYVNMKTCTQYNIRNLILVPDKCFWNFWICTRVYRPYKTAMNMKNVQLRNCPTKTSHIYINLNLNKRTVKCLYKVSTQVGTIVADNSSLNSILQTIIMTLMLSTGGE